MNENILYALGIAYSIVSSLLDSVSYLTTKNVKNQNGQHIRPEENLLPRALLFLLASLLFMWIQKITIFGLNIKTNLIFHLVGLLSTLLVHCYNVALYSLSVGDIHVLSYLSIITTIILERLFRKKDISLWTGVFSMGIIVGGALVAQPPLIMEGLSRHSSNIPGTNFTTATNESSEEKDSSVLSNRMIGIFAMFFAFNILAIITILMKMENNTSTALFIFYQGFWKLLLFPVAVLTLSSQRLFTSEIKDYLQYDVLLHVIAALSMLGSWVTEILALQHISPVVVVAMRGFSLIFDYSGQAVIDCTVPNAMAVAGIVVTVVSVLLVTLEKPICNLFNTGRDLECNPIIPKE